VTTLSLPFLFGKRTIMSYVTIGSSRNNQRLRRGISPVIATTIILAITITLGLGLWAFANSGVGTATTQYSEAVTGYGDIVRNHRFVIANVDFDNPIPNKVSFWIYNNGKVDATISDVHVLLICKQCGGATFSPSDVAPSTLGETFTVAPKTLQKFEFNSGYTGGPSLPAGIYELTVVSEEGLTQTYVKGSD